MDDRERQPEREERQRPPHPTDEHLSNADRGEIPNDNLAAENRAGAAARHLDWSDDELLGDERGGRHPLGQMGDTLQPEEHERLMRERIARGPGDDVSSYGDDLGTLGSDLGVQGGMPGGGPASAAGEAGKQYDGGTEYAGGIGRLAAEQMGSVDPDTPELGGIRSSHAAGQGAGVDAGAVDTGLLPGAGASDVERLRADDDRGRRGADLPDSPADRPEVSERLEGAKTPPAADPQLGEDAGDIGGDLGSRR